MNPFEAIKGGKEQFLIPVQQAATWLWISPFTLYSWAQAQRIPHYKIGKRVMFSKDDLKRWIDDHRVAEAS